MLDRVALIICLIFFLGCQNSQDAVTIEDQNQRALTLMEDGKVDKAIEILNQENQTRPNERTRILLASAYAKKAGLEIQDYWGFTVGYKKFVEDTKVIGQKGIESIFGTQFTPLIQQELEKQDMSAGDLNEILGRIAEVPDKSFDEVQLLVQARKVLEVSESPGGRLYRAILGVVILKFSIQRVVEYIPLAVFAKKSVCQKSWMTVENWFRYSLETVEEILSDIVISHPSQAKTVEETSAKIEALLAELPQKKQELTGQLCPAK